MPLISTKLHGVLDYAGGLGSLAAPKILRDRHAAALLGVSGVGTLVASALTDYELGVRRLLPMRVHLLGDAAGGGLLLAGALKLRGRGARFLDWAPVAAVGISEIAGAALTQRQPGDRGQHAGAQEPPPAAAPGLSGEGLAARTPAADGPSLAPAPVEAPGPSVTPPGRTESEAFEAQPGAEGDTLVAQEEAAAAAQAARIGGAVPSETGDPAMDPVYEAGGGEQDGWEEAEAELIENATHGDGRADPERDAFSPELESDRAGVVYGEADEVVSTERAEDERSAPEGETG